jgi:hypothetical protein
VCPARTIFYPDKAEQVIESVLKKPEKFCSEVQSWRPQCTTQQGGFGQRRNLPPNLFARSADRTDLTDEAFVRESGRVRRERHFCRFAA